MFQVIDSCIKLFDSLEKVLKAEAAMKNTESDDEGIAHEGIGMNYVLNCR